MRHTSCLNVPSTPPLEIGSLLYLKMEYDGVSSLSTCHTLLTNIDMSIQGVGNQRLSQCIIIGLVTTGEHVTIKMACPVIISRMLTHQNHVYTGPHFITVALII